jgi:hypothetical protein
MVQPIRTVLLLTLLPLTSGVGLPRTGINLVQIELTRRDVAV